MDNQLVGAPSVISKMNKNSILMLLREKGPLSRADIARVLQLSSPSVSNNVKLLLDAGYVVEVGEGDNEVGRKSTLLEYNAEKGYFIGVDIGRTQIQIVCSNLLGEVIKADKEKVIKKSGQAIIGQLTNLITRVAGESNIELNDVTSICIGIPGNRDPKLGKNVMAPYFEQWEDIDFAAEIGKIYNGKVIIENCVYLGAFGEMLNGVAKCCSNFIYISYDIGLGSAIIINDKLIKGQNSAAGEIGYMVLGRSYLRSEYLEEGVLETQLSKAELVKNYKDITGEECTFEEIFERAEKKDKAASELVNILVEHFSMALVNVVSIVNPQLIVLSGSVGMIINDKYLDRIYEILKAHVHYFPEIKVSNLGEMGSVYGAVAACLNSLGNNYVDIL